MPAIVLLAPRQFYLPGIGTILGYLALESGRIRRKTAPFGGMTEMQNPPVRLNERVMNAG
jgi:hypothetical protein